MIGNASKPYTTQGNNTTNAIIKGNNTVQQTDINWSKRILGKEALTQINTKLRKQFLMLNLKEKKKYLQILLLSIELSIPNKVLIYLLKNIQV